MYIISISYYFYNMLVNEIYVFFGYDDVLSDMLYYVNVIGYDDCWIGQIFDVFKEEGVVDEILVVLYGDYGIFILENDILVFYYNFNVGCDYVLFVFLYFKLLFIQIKSVVLIVQILFIILDLFVEMKLLFKKRR